ncbi:MAG: hypothetical protein EP330_27975 [Deltaproteobacteria bacterium]|nr:MAG: hypothetical protein EP330_27975 [Deltaproteobacteria bacterium]
MRGVLVVMLALSVGCAPRSVRRGDGFALAEDWDRAAEAYREAMVRRPTSTRIAGKLAMAERGQQAKRVEQADAARVSAEVALREGRYSDAFVQLAEAVKLDPASPSIAELQVRAATEVRTLAEERARSEGWRAAYPMAVLSLRFAPGDAQSAALVTRARSGLFQTVDELVGEGAFEEAGKLAALVGAWEPELAGEARGRVDEAHSAALVREAAKLEKAGDARAWLTYARAASLHASEAAVSGRERLGRATVEDQRVSLRIAPANEALASDLVTLVQRGLAEQGLAQVDRGGDLVLSGVKARWNCTEKVSPRTESQQYVAESRWIENPERLAASRKAYEVRAEVSPLEAEVGQRWSKVESARYQAEQLREAWRIQEDSALRLEETASQSQGWLDEAETALREAQRESQDAASRGEDTSPYEALVDEWRTEVRKREQVLDTAKDAADDARRAAREADEQAGRAEGELTDAHAAYEEVERKLADARAEVDRADAVVAGLASEIEEPVYGTFAYESFEVVRTCVVSADASLGVSGAQAPRSFEVKRSVKDRHHEAYPAYGVAENPLKLSATDAELVEDALASVAATVVGLVRSERDALYQKRAASRDPAVQASMLLLAPRLGDKAWLEAEWGLKPDQLLAR